MLITSITVYNWFYLIYYTEKLNRRVDDHVDSFIYFAKCHAIGRFFFMFAFCAVVPFIENFNNFFIRRGQLITHYTKYDPSEHSTIGSLHFFEKLADGTYKSILTQSMNSINNDNLYISDQIEHDYRNELYNTLILITNGNTTITKVWIESGFLSKYIDSKGGILSNYLTKGNIFVWMYGFIIMILYSLTSTIKDFIIDSLRDNHNNKIVAAIFGITCIYIVYYNNLLRALFSLSINLTQINSAWGLVAGLVLLFLLFVGAMFLVIFLGKVSMPIIGVCFLLFLLYNAFPNPLELIKHLFINNKLKGNDFKKVYGEEVYEKFIAAKSKLDIETDYDKKMEFKKEFYKTTHFIPIIAKIMEYIGREEEKEKKGENKKKYMNFLFIFNYFSRFFFNNATNIFFSIILFSLFVQSMTQIKNVNVRISIVILQLIFLIFWFAFSLYGSGAATMLEEGLKYKFFEYFFEEDKKIATTATTAGTTTDTENSYDPSTWIEYFMTFGRNNMNQDKIIISQPIV
jgi:hypothetical protein